MKKEIEELRNANCKIDELKKRKDEIKAKALEHRDANSVDGATLEIEKINEEIKVAEEELRQVQERSKEKEESKMDLDLTVEKMERSELLASETYERAFFKRLQGKSLNDEETRSITSASSSGGAAIPTMTMDTILGQLTASTSMLDLVTVLNIPELISLPKENVVNDASWVAEDGDSSVSDDTLSNITLSSYKLIRTIKVTATLSAMSIAAFETWIVNTMVKKMKAALDKAVFAGTGSNQPTGFDGKTWDATNSISIAKSSSITFDNLVDLEALVDEDYLGGATWVMNSKTLAQVKKLTDTNKRPVFERIVEDGFRGTILGIRVRLDRNVKDGEAYLGDFKTGYVYNFSKNIEFASSKEAGFMSGATVYRGLALVDGKPTEVKGAVVKFVKVIV